MAVTRAQCRLQPDELGHVAGFGGFRSKYEERVTDVTAKYDVTDNIKQPTGPTVL
jgi:hypothetical protein